MIQDINSQIKLIGDSITWAKKYNKEGFPVDELKKYRRSLKRIANALAENCCTAAYGESQVGKSYLMSSLLSSPNAPFVIQNGNREYSFIDELNPSGGNTSKTESTGVITRFTISNANESMKDFVKIKNLSVADLIMLLVDSYYNDLKIDENSVLPPEQIKAELAVIKTFAASKNNIQRVLTEDDVEDICDYITEEIGGSTSANIKESGFRKIVSANIQYIPCDKWCDVFGVLWNKNEALNGLFKLLISEYEKIQFETDVYVPFTAVLRDKGTLLKIEWLDSVCGKTHESETDEIETDVYNEQGQLITRNFKKSSLSALIAELTFVLPPQIAEERKFLNKIDLLDFPGARSREKFKEQEVAAVLPTILRRGKVAYLFKKYSRSQRISSVLFCHHNDQKNEPSLGETIEEWIEKNVGKNRDERAKELTRTNGISPLFMVATKFNIELERTKNDNTANTELLAEHWKRFKTVLPEIIKPATWFDEWVTRGGLFRSEAFQSIYLLRDYYWSMKNQVFDGYDEKSKTPESNLHQFNDYPDYFDNLKNSFLANEFVKKHFADPAAAWKEVASVNSDGSRAIIRDLDAISEVLDRARHEKYLEQLRKIQNDVIQALNAYYEPENSEEKNRKTKKIVGDIRFSLELSIPTKQELFGSLVDQLMIPVDRVRDIAVEIIISKTKVPKPLNEVDLIRNMAKISLSDSREVNIQKLCNRFDCSYEELEEKLAQKGFALEDLISNGRHVATTVEELVANDIFDDWGEFMNERVTSLDEYMPHSRYVSQMFQVLCQKLGVKDLVTKRIGSYIKMYPEDDRPNVIADYVALTLNNFICSVGRTYMTDDDIAIIRKKADSCNIEIDLSSEVSDVRRVQVEVKPDPDVINALKALEDASLMKLPFCDNFRRWENLLLVGILFAADVSQCDPVSNAAIHKIIEACNNLYQNK